MKSPETPKEEALFLVQEAQNVAEEILAGMDGDECVKMVRSFCGAMIDWQPNIAEHAGEPVMLGLHSLAATFVFQRAFVKAYEDTDKRIKAMKAVQEALGGLE